MNMVLSRNWWALALRGVAAIVLGLVALIVPAFMLLWLVLCSGRMRWSTESRDRGGDPRGSAPERWWPFALEGLANIVVAIITFAMPTAAAFALLLLVSAWAILTGVLRIAAAIRLRKEIQGEWLLILNGALSVVLGILLLVLPSAGLVTLVWLLGVYAIVFGAMLVGLAFRLRRHHHVHGSAPRPAGAR